MKCLWITVDDVPSVTTVNGLLFSGRETALLAAGILKRFGYNRELARGAWGRLLQSSVSEEHFDALCTFGEIAWRQAVQNTK